MPGYSSSRFTVNDCELQDEHEVFVFFSKELQFGLSSILALVKWTLRLLMSH